ncbi:MAG: TdeIII family type II restriction endonuclease [Bacteroidales bacterium]
MSLTKEQIILIEDIIKDTLIKKLYNYKPETNHMPFHYRLLGRDRMALYSFIHSLNTAFGNSIFEPIAVSIASFHFLKVEKQYSAGDYISEEAQRVIQDIMNELSISKVPNKHEEIEKIRSVCNTGLPKKIKVVKVDLFLEDDQGCVYLFDLKTAKPNISNFKDFKRTLLEWVAIFLHKKPDTKINSYLAIPYNPYEPQPYQRWTMRGMLDIDNEVKVAEEFWNFLGKEKGTYEILLDCFEKAGIELRPIIDDYFNNFRIGSEKEKK